MTDKERINKLSQEEQERLEFATKKLKDVLTTFNPDKPTTKTMQTYSRESLRTYLKNPATDANAKNLRKLSNYLYSISHVYRRMINFKAEQITCKSWTAYPIVSMTEDNDAESILAEYDRITKIVTNMHMESQILKLMLKFWREGVCYGYTYGDPEKDGTFFIHILDPDYCKISCASYDGGVIGFMFDMSYFNGKEERLEYYDKEFKTLYNQFQSDKVKWKQLPLERTICLKSDPDELEYTIPPYSGMLEMIISLTDLQAAQAEVDEIANYKMLWAKLNTLKGTNTPDDFEVDLDLALNFLNKIAAALPESIGYAISPMDLGVIDFNNDQAKDTNTLNKAYSQLIETNGSIIFNSNKITNSTSFKLALKTECDDAMKPVEQLNAWLRYYLRYNYNNETIVVEYSDVSPYFVSEELETLTKIAGLGVPVKLKLASLLNETPQKVHGMDYLERELLQLGTSRWNNPLVSSNTVSADDSNGAPTKSDGDLTDEGEASRDKDTNQK